MDQQSVNTVLACELDQAVEQRIVKVLCNVITNNSNTSEACFLRDYLRIIITGLVRDELENLSTTPAYANTTNTAKSAQLLLFPEKE